jgi:hypothetical protein
LKVYCIVASVNDIWFDFFGGKFSLLEVEYEVEETSKVIKCNKLTLAPVIVIQIWMRHSARGTRVGKKKVQQTDCAGSKPYQEPYEDRYLRIDIICWGDDEDIGCDSFYSKGNRP